MLARLGSRNPPSLLLSSVSHKGFAAATGINLKKGGNDPELPALQDLPEWAQTVATPQTSLYELNRSLAEHGLEEFAKRPEAVRTVKLQRRHEIRRINAQKAKK